SRPRVVQFSLTEEEFEDVSRAAERSGLARGAFAAEAALASARGARARAWSPLREALAEVIAAAGLVRRAGTNLNQAVTRLNATGQRDSDFSIAKGPDAPWCASGAGCAHFAQRPGSLRALRLRRRQPPQSRRRRHEHRSGICRPRQLCVQASGIGSLCCGEDRPRPCSGEARQLAWTQAGSGALTRRGGLGGAFASPPGAEALDGQLDRTLVITGAVDVAPKRPVERVEVGAREAAGSGDRLLAQDRHVVHAPQDATVSRPGEDDLLRLRASERAGWQALAAELSLDEAGDQVARRTQV